MKFFIFTVFIAAAAAVKFDSSRCAHGPEYWCMTRYTAQQCGAIQYCTDNAWPKVSLTNDVCTDCKNFVGDIQNMLENTTVQTEILNEIKMICADLGPYADECSSLVDQYGTIVISLLVSELNPASVCGTVGFCSGKYLKAGSNLCSDCEAFFGDVQGLLKNTTIQQEIDNFILTTCQQLGIKAADCSLVIAFAPQVFDFLATELDPKTVCSAISFCQSSLLSRFNSVNFQAGDMCADCKAFFADSEAMLKNTTVQNELKQDLLPVCNYLGTYEEECKLAIESFLPTILNTVAGYLDPATACPAIGFCPSIEVKHELKTNQLEAVNADPCTDCKAFFGDVKTVLMNETNEETIINGLKTLCADLGSYAAECSTLVDQYGKTVISLLASSLDASVVCKDIGFCSAGGLLKLKELEDELKNVCDLFGTEADQCKTYIDTYGPIVFSLLASYVDPKTVCTAIQFCPASFVNAINVKTSGDMCNTCKKTASEIDAYLNNPVIQKSIEEALDIACNSVTSIAEECKAVVDLIVPKVLVELATLLEPDTFCSLFGFCSSQKNKVITMVTMKLATPIKQVENKNLVALTNVVPAVKMSQGKPVDTKVTDSTICQVCEEVAQALEGLLTENSTETEIVNAVEKVCDILPSKFKTECNALVTQYGAVLIELLVQSVPPSKLCSDLHLCSSKEMILSASEQCTLCEYVIKTLDSMISENSTDQEIINALDKVCSYLPKTIAADCEDFVNTYTPQILGIIRELSPDQVCTALGLCTSKVVKNVDASAECVLCEFVMQELDTILSENSTEQEIINALEKVCSLLPNTLQDDCDSLVKQYGPEIIELLKSQSPDTICTSIGLCGAKPKVTASGVCILCEFVMTTVDKYLAENSTEAEIKKVLVEVCNILPTTITADCITFVNKYSDTIIQLILNDIDPVNVCKELTLCTDSVAVQQLKVTSDETCDLCKMVVMYGDKYLVENSTVAEIVKILHSVCDVFEGDYRSKCQSIVVEYGPAIPALIAQLTSPTKVCQKMELCQTGEMLGQKECTFGPSYWCASMKNAQKCNAVVHCKNHVWN
ncbi:uncharacterized protein [Antedon mediterranea]|uniref:uncharacterized protein isoform X2 n=1 Tax=Antedon mediterranea TaxID=105859 RepID=UPI003AF98B3F